MKSSLNASRAASSFALSFTMMPRIVTMWIFHMRLAAVKDHGVPPGACVVAEGVNLSTARM